MTSEAEAVLERLLSVRQHRHAGRRAPHKPLLILLVLGRLHERGSSRVPWSEAELRLADLVEEFGPPSQTSPAQRAAYPFTRLRSDGFWLLDKDVRMDAIQPLRQLDVSGSMTSDMEAALCADPALLRSAAKALVLDQFPSTVAEDVLAAVGFDPTEVLAGRDLAVGGDPPARRRDATWRSAVLRAWDRQCAFCGYDGQVAGATVGVDAAHVRWFAFDGPDDLDNGLALCVLHHKLFDLGALGLTADLTVKVSQHFSARTDAGRLVYELHGRSLSPRPGTAAPAGEHLDWHDREVFKGIPLAA